MSNAPLSTDQRAQTGVKYGALRPPYLDNDARMKYANEPERIRRGFSGDKLRRKAFERKL